MTRFFLPEHLGACESAAAQAIKPSIQSWGRNEMAKDKPKKPKIITGINVGDLSKGRPTRIPEAAKAAVLQKPPISLKKIGIHIGIVVAVILIAYGNSLLGQFVFKDDYITNVLTARISDDAFWRQLGWLFMGIPLSQPWFLISLALDFNSFSYQPVWYHIVNVVFHSVCC